MEPSDIQWKNEDTNEENIIRRIENYAVALNADQSDQKMCEESTCLVPPLDTSQSRPQETRRMLLQLPSFCMPTSFEPVLDSAAECQNREELGKFHHNALREVSHGKAQYFLGIILGIGLAADCVELNILGFILPGAELQFCIGEHKKKWLVSITLLAMAGGSMAWGILGDHLGRRRALISALSVAALFSMVASVMPTYGTFMTARFCSGLGVAGAFPLSFIYIMEMCPRIDQFRLMGLVYSFWPHGAFFMLVASYLTMPITGAGIVQDNREHWSSWHQGEKT